MINSYHRFIQLASKTMAPTYQTVANKPKLLVWNEMLQTAFQKVKYALASGLMLHHLKKHAPLTLSADASNVAAGDILEN